MEFFSLSQCVGYIAFVLGFIAFLQKKDRPLKFFVGLESIAYTVHFSLLGNPTAAASALLTSLRSFLALKTRSSLVAVVVIVANVGIGLMLTKSLFGWLPVIGSCVSTYAIFTMKGIPMRLVILSSTFCWLANNILSGSIGGTLLETVIAIVNTSTVLRMWRSAALERSGDPAGELAPISKP
ncbi:YgjV family protein [Oryzomonas japonica]|uniref:YgjV family protein n=1 Tax=Oryzomonas japonica TaxID=2603858 RepID=A0A7J4ZNU7_9BACT|nr:YgjV family protein [Oryzomonas japonica]KAB0664014.1 YgjV family protein [Oryzomonas japonica]